MAKNGGFEFWRTSLRGARYIVAPMVDQSELAWRLLSRKYGAQLCYTPMLHASVFRRDPNYRREHLVTTPEDRPLIVQFCANDPQTLLEAALLAQPYCQAIDLNLGCPQTIAKKGHYGAFLQDEWDLLRRMVSLLHQELTIPITCKIRVFEEVEKTVQYAQMLEKAGCQLLTVHGRKREQKGGNTGLASWEHIAAVKQSVQIPVFANGNIQFLRDVERCLQETGVDGVMSAEGNLFNPALFTGEQPLCWTMVEEYLHLAKAYPPSLSHVRGHIFKLWLNVLKQPEYLHYREKFGTAQSIAAFEQISAELKGLLLERFSVEELSAEFSLDTIPFFRCQPYVRPSPDDQVLQRTSSLGSEDAAATLTTKRRRKREKPSLALKPKRRHWDLCVICIANPRGVRCEHKMCKACCKVHCRLGGVPCTGHKFHLRHKNEAADRGGGGGGGGRTGGVEEAEAVTPDISVDHSSTHEERDKLIKTNYV